MFGMPWRRIVLADLERPPDTSLLMPCDDEETAAAVERLRARLLRRRQALHGGSECVLDVVVAALRRLQNPQIAAYRSATALVLSEPFNAVPTSLRAASASVAMLAVRKMFGGRPPMRLVKILRAFGEPALAAAVCAGVRIAIIPQDRCFSEFSPSVASLVPGIDGWSAPPSGLFVVEEKKILLRSRALSMTAAHEFAHALDAVLARRPRSYFSFESEELRHYFATATGFVNEYAASGLDEYFAECVRAYLEINDPRCMWLPLTRKDLFSRDPRMFVFLERLFASGLAV
jgi:hypothetical protein